jgi:hypothetical protein
MCLSPFLWPGSVHTPWLPSVNARLLVRGYSSPHDVAGSVEIVRVHAAQYDYVRFWALPKESGGLAD